MREPLGVRVSGSTCSSVGVLVVGLLVEALVDILRDGEVVGLNEGDRLGDSEAGGN